MPDTIAAMPAADKLAVRARPQVGQVLAAPDGATQELLGGCGESLPPTALFPHGLAHAPLVAVWANRQAGPAPLRLALLLDVPPAQQQATHR